jgi:acyl carrier protein
MDALVEPRVRRVVADVLGVDPTLITPTVSLSDDLAVDSLDLVELCTVLEDEFGVPLARGVPSWVRTYAQLVKFIDDARPVLPPLMVVTVIPPDGAMPPQIARSEWMTPYGIESVREDAQRLVPGTTLDIALDAPDDDAIAGLEKSLARLSHRGIRVRVHRPGTSGVHIHAA